MKFKFKYFSIALIVIIYTISGCSQKDQVLEKPNIVWITSEDNSKHYMKLFDENGAETPNIGKLAEQGILFTRAFSNSPVCSAARSTLISGCYGPRIASHYHRRQVRVPMPEGVEMYPAYLKKAGYYTTNNNKEDYNIFKADNVWDESSKQATWRNRAEGQPFFHIQNFGVTHESGLFFTDEEMNSEDTLTNRNSVFIFPTHPNTEVFRYTNARYRDKIVIMDRQVGKLLDELKKDGLMENTFIFYYGDHGGVLPGSKGYLMEVGVHVPLVVYIPEKYDMVRSVRVDNFKYMRNYQPFNFDGLWNNYRYRQTGYREWYELFKKGELNEVQAQFFTTKPPEALYDLENDPFETNNLADDSNYKETLAKMRDKLDSWVKGMPDLSFYPEHYLINNAFDNPVAFGQANKAAIQKYIDIANLELVPFTDAKTGIEAALNSEDPWERYWGIIVCSRFEKEALEFLPVLKIIAEADSELINRVRAAEFMGITKLGDPVEIIENALYESEDATESLLILNCAVLMKDGYNYSFNFNFEKINETVREDSQVKRRLEYFELI